MLTSTARDAWTYDNENRCLNELRSSGAHHTYTYAPDGLRRSAHFGSTADVITFIWDGDDLLNERIEGANAARYTVLDGEVLSGKRGANRYLYVPDPLGSVNYLVDTSRTIAGTYVYAPYGEVLSHTGANTAMQFVGALGYYTGLTNRAYVRARHYRPDLGRWQTRDPIGCYCRGELNGHGYCVGRPVSVSDPLGLSPASARGWWEPWWTGIAEGVIGDLLGPGPDVGDVDRCWVREYMYWVRDGGLSPAGACEIANRICGRHWDCGRPPHCPPAPHRPTDPEQPRAPWEKPPPRERPLPPSPPPGPPPGPPWIWWPPNTGRPPHGCWIAIMIGAMIIYVIGQGCEPYEQYPPPRRKPKPRRPRPGRPRMGPGDFYWYC